MEENKHAIKSWKPDRPISKGATAYHNAVVDAPHYIKVLQALIDIVTPKIKEGGTVVDFGSGTGVSALCLLKNLKVPIELWLVDNSPAWLGKAYEVLGSKKFVKCLLLERKNDHYATLAETIGEKKVDYVMSGNTVHLIEDIEYTFRGIRDALKDGGIFSFDSGNIINKNSPEGALMIDGTVERVHDIALDLIRNDPEFSRYKDDINKRIKEEQTQRKFVFPDPRPAEFYLDALGKTGFEYEEPQFKLFNVKYSDWLNFLRVRRLQAGILPEIGGYEPTQKEEHDRDILITKATKQLFKELEENNPMSDEKSFTIEIGYFTSRKSKKSHHEYAQEKQEKLLQGKTALVTGASKGIGKAIAIEFARNGANIIVNYNKNREKAMGVVEEVKKYGVESVAINADVSDFDKVSSMMEEIKKKFQNVDILINNAGIIRDKTFEKMSDKEWSEVINTNLTGIYNVTKSVLPMINPYGKVISISSIVGLDGNFGQTNYAASKAGIIGFSKSLAKELAKKKITVNAIAPGFIQTDIIRGLPKKVRKNLENMIPLKKLGTPEDIANAAVFLASGKSRYITGEVIRVDGGLSL